MNKAILVQHLFKRLYVESPFYQATKFVTLAVFLFSIGAPSSYAEESWLVVNSDKISFKLPSRPVGSKESFAKIWENRNAYSTYGFMHISAGLRECPKSSALINKIFNKIIKENKLTDFIENGPNIKLGIKCFDDRKALEVETRTGPFATDRHYIVIPVSVISYLQSESEIAFFIAHEIAHILLGHLELGLDLIKQLEGEIQSSIIKHKTFEHVAKIEPEADMYGAILMFNAGYDPYSAYHAISRAERFYFGYFWGTLLINANPYKFFDEGHGSSRERRLKIEGYFQSSNVENKYKPIVTSEMEEARKEIEEYQNK